jgi:uncharacterized protein YbaP (TraB family)
MASDAIRSRIMSAFVRTSLCAALLLAATQTFAAAPSQPKPSPAMWKLEKDGSTLYFFGSIHILPRGMEWKTPVVQRAIDQSDVFFFEMPLSDGAMRDAAAASTKHVYLPKGQKLSSTLSPAGKKKLAELAKKRGLDLETIDRMRPWFVSEILAAGGTDPANIIEGVDRQIGSEILLARKTRRYFESGPEQADMSARMGDADGGKGFEIAMATAGRSDKDFKRLANAWVAGDVNALENLILTEMRGLPQAHKIMFDDRNAAWAKQIPELFREHRTFFITVGAGHFAGKGSVIDLLCREGHRIERVDTRTGNTRPGCPPRAQVLAAGIPHGPN